VTTAVYTPTASQYASAATHLEMRAEWRGVRCCVECGAKHERAERLAAARRRVVEEWI